MAGELAGGEVDNTPVVERDDFPFTHGEFFDLANLASLRDFNTRGDIPQLSTALEIWLKTGDLSLLRGRVDSMPRAHLAPVFLLNAYGFVDEVRLPGGQRRPFMLVNHEPSFSAGENAEVLEKQKEAIYQTLGINQLPQVFKTVTFCFTYQGISYKTLVSGIGDFRMDREIRANIGVELGLPKSASRTATINPTDFDTTLLLGLQPGMVKPVLEPHLVGNVHGICYLKGRVEPEDFVAISVSHVDSMIMQVCDFEFLFDDYAKDNYIGFDLTRTQNYDFYRNNRRWK